jgi:dihydrofolate synthase/folylpolyglutamate synthase
MTYEQIVQELESLGIMPTRMPSLAPMKDALQKTGLIRAFSPRRQVIIAGTNGKGTTAATLSALLHAQGIRVGLYTSPHLVTTRERIRIAEQDVSEEAFVQAYLELKPWIQGLSHFETLTLIAAHLFQKSDTEWNVWEVGLGGLHDATNAIPHHYCGIAELGLDHQNILGNTLQEIAEQKFGIISPGNSVVSHPLVPELEPLREEVIRKTSCNWHLARDLSYWPGAELALPGSRARRNTALALELLEQMGFSARLALPHLSQVRWPGRFSRIQSGHFPCPVYLSGDHNPQGAQSLVELLQSMQWERLHLLVGIGKDKDAAEILSILSTLPRRSLTLTEIPFKPLSLADYPPTHLHESVDSQSDPLAALSAITQRASARDLIVITGSLYLVGIFLGAYPSCNSFNPS